MRYLAFVCGVTVLIGFAISTKRSQALPPADKGAARAAWDARAAAQLACATAQNRVECGRSAGLCEGRGSE